jgi:hypothetical protein
MRALPALGTLKPKAIDPRTASFVSSGCHDRQPRSSGRYTGRNRARKVKPRPDHDTSVPPLNERFYGQSANLRAEVERFGSGTLDGEAFVCCRAFGNNSARSEGRIELQQAEVPHGKSTVRKGPDRSGHPRGASVPDFHQAGHDHPVRSALTVDCDPLAGAPALGVARLDPLTEYRDLSDADPLDPAYNLTRHLDAAGAETPTLPHRNGPHDLPDPQCRRACALAVDPHFDIRRVGNPEVVHDDRPEAPDRADHAGSADAAVAVLRIGGCPGPADAPVARLLALRMGQRRRRGQQPEKEAAPSLVKRVSHASEASVEDVSSGTSSR